MEGRCRGEKRWSVRGNRQRERERKLVERGWVEGSCEREDKKGYSYLRKSIEVNRWKERGEKHGKWRIQKRKEVENDT